MGGDGDVRVQRIGWLGIRTERFDETVAFFRDTLGLPLCLQAPGRAMFTLANGDPVDVYEASNETYAHFVTGPVIGFVVDDVEAGRARLQAAGIEVIGPVGRGDGYEWAHFRGPDGYLYELQRRLPAEDRPAGHGHGPQT